MNAIAILLHSLPRRSIWAPSTTYDWVVLILLIVALSVAVLSGAFLLFFYVKKKLRASKAGTENEAKMLEQIQQLNEELYDVTKERDALLGIPGAGGSGKKGKGDEEDDGKRFTRLLMIDEMYKDGDFKVQTPADSQGLDLAAICTRFRDFACSQLKLYYTIDTVREFFASMGASHFIILEGISGTGKTSLPYCLGRFFEHPASICAVQPNWRDRSEVLGYYNDFTKKFTETTFLASVYDANYRDDMSIIVLDEMNLARVEYYFAEFLSVMEMPKPEEWLIDVIAGFREDDPVKLKEGKILIPQNIWFIGTANNDDSTFTITDKVYDRAMSLFFENKGKAFDAPYTEALPIPAEYLNGLFAQAKIDHPISQDTLEKFAILDDFVIENFHLAFGNRIMKQLNSFVPCYISCGGTELNAFDFIFKTKILKKFEVLNVGYLRDELLALQDKLTELFGETEFPQSRAKIAQFLKLTK